MLGQNAVKHLKKKKKYLTPPTLRTPFIHTSLLPSIIHSYIFSRRPSPSLLAHNVALWSTDGTDDTALVNLSWTQDREKDRPTHTANERTTLNSAEERKQKVCSRPQWMANPCLRSWGALGSSEPIFGPFHFNKSGCPKNPPFTGPAQSPGTNEEPVRNTTLSF